MQGDNLIMTKGATNPGEVLSGCIARDAAWSFSHRAVFPSSGSGNRAGEPRRPPLASGSRSGSDSLFQPTPRG